MSKKVLILHGWGGSDFPHWQAWLATELIKKNFTVSFPSLPDRDLPKLQSWLEFLKVEFEHFKPDIVVCHSLANSLWLHFCEQYSFENIEKLMLVAPVRPTCEIPEIKEFFPYPYTANLKANEIISVGSTNDIYMSVNEAIEFQSRLNIGMKILENAGHINAQSGYGELSCAVDWITGNLVNH